MFIGVVIIIATTGIIGPIIGTMAIAVRRIIVIAAGVTVTACAGVTAPGTDNPFDKRDEIKKAGTTWRPLSI